MKILDLFCGGGGAAQGYANAGYEVIGIDIEPHPRFPFEFYQMDWRDGLGKFAAEVDCVHASPPCQDYSCATLQWQKTHSYPDLVSDVRDALQETGLPFVIENVERAPIIRDLMLCGTMFDLHTYHRGFRLDLWRHRFFEFSKPVPRFPPLACNHAFPACSVFGHGVGGEIQRKWGHVPFAKMRQLMGAAWLTRDELGESIPPAYTEFIGKHWADRR